MIGVIDVGGGNIGSLLNMLAYVGAPARAVSTPEDVASARALILPGVGSFDPGMARLRGSGLLDTLERRVRQDGIPFLGICLGMQLLTRGSEEGTTSGLGWIAATTRRFAFPPDARGLRVPHMGWNQCHARAGAKLFAFASEPETPRFYFVHSYHVVCDAPDLTAASTTYGGDFTSAVQHGNIHGVQFHPEKSHRWGQRLLERFAALT